MLVPFAVLALIAEAILNGHEIPIKSIIAISNMSAATIFLFSYYFGDRLAVGDDIAFHHKTSADGVDFIELQKLF